MTYIVSIALYVLSLALPAVGDFLGLPILVMGWFPGAADSGHGGVLFTAFWLANPLYLFGMVLFKNGIFRLALASAFGALFLCLAFYADNAFHVSGPSLSLYLGFYAWMASFIALLFASFKSAFGQRK